eukprot:s520_g11.t1
MGCYERQQDLFEAAATGQRSTEDNDSTPQPMELVALSDSEPFQTVYLEHPEMVSSGNTCTTTGTMGRQPPVTARSSQASMGQSILFCSRWIEFWYDGGFSGSPKVAAQKTHPGRRSAGKAEDPAIVAARAGDVEALRGMNATEVLAATETRLHGHSEGLRLASRTSYDLA